MLKSVGVEEVPDIPEPPKPFEDIDDYDYDYDDDGVPIPPTTVGVADEISITLAVDAEIEEITDKLKK